MDPRVLPPVLMLASGFAGLGYQIVWTQQSAVWLGHEAPAMLAIVAAFFGGIGLGALWLGRRIDRSTRPAQWYAACEVVIGAWGIALLLLMTPASRLLLQWSGPEPSALWQWTVAFAGTFLLLLPATAAMGATLPAMERILRAHAQRAAVALLYSANTFGAMLGVMGAAFFLVPRLGLSVTAAICVSLNLLCALMARKVLAADVPPVPVRQGSPIHSLRLLAVTGLLGIGYEVLVVRVLSQVAENTIFTFAILLAVYLVGTALGAAAYERWARAPDPGVQDRLLRWQALSCLGGVLLLAAAEPMKQGLLGMLGAGMRNALIVEALLACGAFLLPTMVMGAVFSHLVTAARAAGASFGVALGINTLAAAIAPMVFGVWLLPAIGVTGTLLLVSVAYLFAVSAWRSRLQWAGAAAAALLALWHPPLAAVSVPEGGRVLSHAEGVSANVSVVEDARGVATLHINNRQQEGSSVTLYSDARQALLPLLLHPAPKQALFLGLGTGATARAAVMDSGLSVDAVELLPEVIDASALFAQLQRSEAQQQLRLWNADARRFVRSATGRYDVIIADNFHPARSGSAALYTREHFGAVRERLAPGGLFCQWLPLHQIDLATLRSIVRTFTEVYPQSWALLATNSLDTPTIGLIARPDAPAFDTRALRARLQRLTTINDLERIGIEDEFALFGAFIAGGDALRAFAGNAPLNTDDHPVVAYLAPRITYTPDSLPRDRLIGLLENLRVSPRELFADASGPWNARLAAYWQARNRFIEVGRDVRPSGEVRAMLAQVGAPLLEVLRISPDFRPAYDPLLSMAATLADTDQASARDLLAALAQVQPRRTEAGEALAALETR
jgi:spermidine synthase